MTTPVRHSALLAYLLLWLTAGLYWFYWLYRMMRDLNAMHQNTTFDMKRIASLAAVYLLLYAVVLAICVGLALQRSDLWQGMMLLGICMALGWFAGCAHLHVRIGRAILGLQTQQTVRRRVSPGLAGLLFFIYFVTVPYLQTHMNSVIGHEDTT